MFDRRLSKRSFAKSSESSNRTNFSDGWDQIGCRLRAAWTAFGTYVASQACIVSLFASACVSSSVSIRKSARAARWSRAASDSPAPMIVGVTKSPCGAAACMTKPARNSSPMIGSNTTVVANSASPQSRMPVRSRPARASAARSRRSAMPPCAPRRRSSRPPQRARGCRGSGPARSAACAAPRPRSRC